MDLTVSSQTNSSDYYDDNDTSFLDALATAVLPGDDKPPPQPISCHGAKDARSSQHSNESEELEPPPATQPSLKRNRLEAFEENRRSRAAENHTAQAPDDRNDIYGQSHFGEFGEYMRRKRAKLQIQNADLKGDGSGNQIFRGLAIYINGYTQPSVQDLRKLIIRHGGVFQPYLDKKSIVTHIITCSLTAAKMREFKHMKVVRPEWLVESVERSALLPWNNYIFAQTDRPESAHQGLRIKQLEFATSAPQVEVPLPVTGTKRKARQISPESDRESDVRTPKKKNPPPLYQQPRKDGKSSKPTSFNNGQRPQLVPRNDGANSDISALVPDVLRTPIKKIPPPTYQQPRKKPSSVNRGQPASESAGQPLNSAVSDQGRVSHEHATGEVSLQGDQDSTHQPRKETSAIKPPSKNTGQQTLVPPALAPDAPPVPRYAADKSNPLAQRAMANPFWRKAHTSVAPDFVEGFYKNSRLHYLAMWKAELKDMVMEAMERAEAPTGPKGLLVGRVASELGRNNISGVAGGRTGVDGKVGVSMRGAELVMNSKSPVKNTSKGKGKEKAVDDRVIMHCDFDCFFVSAGLLGRPQLRGKPVVVCHSQGGQGGGKSTSEIASASYEARACGIRNGMSLRQARELCPGIITMPYEFDRYKKLSLKFYTILMSHADDLQAVSVDEALIDVTSIITQLQSSSSTDDHTIDPAKDFAEILRGQIRNATACEVSIGISHNILLARLATRRAKPAGSYHLVPEDVENFLSPLTIRDLHGFGSSTKQKAQEKLGTANLGELMDKSKAVLCDALGKATGETLYNALRGIDERELESDKPRKSVSCEINYGIRFENGEQAEVFIYQMAKEVAKRLDDIGMLGRSITLKIMKRDPTSPIEPPKFLGHGACDLYNKQISLIGAGGRATSDERVIGEHANRILRSFHFDPSELRGIGIQIQKLEKPPLGPAIQQVMLPFRRVPSPKKASAYPPAVPQMVLHPPSDDFIDPVTETREPNIDLPTFSQVDTEVFDALPEDIRKELEAEIVRRSEPSVSGAAQPPKPPAPPPKEIFPKKIVVKGNNYEKIVRQQRPRNRPSVSPAKAPWGLAIRKRGYAGASKLSNAALRKLNIDPEVFRSLRPNVQHEQLTMLRLLKERGKLPTPPSKWKILKPLKRKPIPPHLLWRAPPPKARFVAPPILRQRGKEKKQFKFLTETGDIQGAIEGWVNTYQRWAPKEKDIEFFTNYLLKAVNGKEFGDVSMERAVAVLKWWLVLLRQHWGGSEYVDDPEHLDPSQLDPVGEAWWKAFREVKAKMDAIAKARFGGKLSLR